MATIAPASPVRRGLAFLAGVGFASVPTVGPYLAVLAIASGHLRIQRADLWWWTAALLLGTPWLLTGHAWAGVGAVAQALAVWLIFRAASEARHTLRDTSLPLDVGAGLLVGLAGAMAFGLVRSAGWRLETARTLTDLLAWTENPALFGHAMLLLSALLAVVLTSPAMRGIALALGAVAVLVSGALEAVLAWLLIAIGLRLVRRGGLRGPVTAEWSLIALMLAAALGLGGVVGLGRPGFGIDLQPPVAGANLFRGTEATGAWWYPLGVTYDTLGVEVGGVTRTGFAVTKTEVASWSRLQQVVELRPDQAYVVALLWRAPEVVRPGLDGWGRAARDRPATEAAVDGGRDANLAATYRDGAWQLNATAAFEILDAGVDAVGAASAQSLAGNDSWTRGWVAFRYRGDAPLYWYVGAVPDRSSAVGATTTFAEFQLIEGTERLPYVPNASDVRPADLRASRLPLWHEALEALVRRPWLGWGPSGFTAAAETLRPADAAHRPVAAHAHSLVLDTWLERGAIGFVGLLLLAGVLALRTLQQRDRAMAVVLAGVALLNLFDTTLLNGALIYPLAAVLGWRAVGSRRAAEAQTGVGSAAAVRLALAAADVAVAAAAISLGLAAVSERPFMDALLAGWTTPLAYATLLWPAMALASGLYPGYGRAAHDELARGVRAAAAATVTLGFVALLLGGAVALGPRELLVAGAASVVASPLARWFAKRLLQQARLWGRPVVIVGTGPVAARVARHLLDHPGIGLHPVAAFGDADWDVPGLPVTGALERLWAYLEHHPVRHAIVAPEAAARVGYDEVLRRGERLLRTVHFVPDLHGVPASSVVAAPLGTALGLQVRNRLASGGNRAIKRALDLAGAILLLALLGPPLLLVAAWVRLDSRGPALYLSPRIGRYGRAFACIKFRTMHVDAEARLERLLTADPALRREYERYHKLADDPRVTRAGRLLRRLSIDELPQLLNVFLGHMSLVGPRPYLVRELAQMGAERDLIFLARPGMTGYWQVEGRNDVTFAERQAMEAAYVRNWSVWWDLEIVARTPAALLAKKGK